MSYVERAITLTIALGGGDFGDTGQNTITLSGLRVSAMIEKWGGPSFNVAQVRVSGLSLSLMNQVSSLWTPLPKFRNNTIVIQAGDAKTGMNIVFRGGIFTAWANIQNQPESSLEMICRAALVSTMRPVPPSSYNGSVDAVMILSNLASQMGYGFENSGVPPTMLSNSYYPGTLAMQAIRCAQAANVDITFDDEVVMAIWPKGGSRQGEIPLVSAATGMHGYPAYNGNGIALKTLYNPAIKFGAKIKVETEIKAAAGIWNIWKLTHNLQSLTPNGNWFTEIEGKTIAI